MNQVKSKRIIIFLIYYRIIIYSERLCSKYGRINKVQMNFSLEFNGMRDPSYFVKRFIV